ncbi:reverse transcriptase domain-containing protein [Tanacetum coccineum]
MRPTNQHPLQDWRGFERTGSVFSRSNCTKDYKVKFATGTLIEEALSWWNSFAQPIGIEEAYKITWVEFKKLLIKKYCPRTEVQKMEDEFYHLTVKGNDLKAYVRRFQELATLCPTMVPDSEKMMEVFIGVLPRSHLTKNCRNNGPATESNLLPVTVTCHACGEKGHYANQCRKTTDNNAQGRAYMLRDRNAHQDPNVVTGDLVVNVETVMGGNSPKFGPGKGVKVEKPSGVNLLFRLSCRKSIKSVSKHESPATLFIGDENRHGQGPALLLRGVGLCVADSHTGNHREDDFMPLEIIQRFLGVFRSRSLLSLKGRPSSQNGGSVISFVYGSLSQDFKNW